MSHSSPSPDRNTGGGGYETRVFLENLPKDVRKDELIKSFSCFGDIAKVYLIYDPPGSGFVEFTDHRDALVAADQVDGTDILGAGLKIKTRLTRGGYNRGGRGFTRGGRGDYSRGGGYGESSGGFSSRGRSMRGGRGPYDGSRDSYSSSRSSDFRGSFRGSRGSYGDSRGSYRGSRGSYGDSRGGYRGSRGGFESRGRFQSSRGGFRGSRGSFDKPRRDYDNYESGGSSYDKSFDQFEGSSSSYADRGSSYDSYGKSYSSGGRGTKNYSSREDDDMDGGYGSSRKYSRQSFDDSDFGSNGYGKFEKYTKYQKFGKAIGIEEPDTKYSRYPTLDSSRSHRSRSPLVDTGRSQSTGRYHSQSSRYQQSRSRSPIGRGTRELDFPSRSSYESKRFSPSDKDEFVRPRSKAPRDYPPLMSIGSSKHRDKGKDFASSSSYGNKRSPNRERF